MTGFESAINKLNRIQQKYDEISEKLSDMKTINNQKLYKELSKELSTLEDIINEYKKYKEIAKQISDTEEIINTESDKEIINMASEELENLNTELEKKQVILKKLLIPPVENADKNIIVEIRAGTGGDEAALFCGDLFRMYNKFAKKNWAVEVISSSDTGLGGYKEIIFSITGKNVYDNLRFEYGGHRVQRVPVTESSGRIHTSAVTVAIMPEAEETDVDIKTEDLRVDVFRASGAGGQHVNKTESAVRITHLPTGFVVQCQDNRSQHQNKASAMKVLRSRLYEYQKNILDKERSNMRKEQVGSGDRSQKIRTYNFPQNRVTDHRINLTLYKLEIFMEGDLDDMIEALKVNDAEERINPHYNMTINEAFKKAIEDLKLKDFIENPILEARILICHVLKINEKELIIIKDKKKVHNTEWKKIKRLINKRLKKNTIACIINNKHFYDGEFYVNKNVLTPRPETELLIDIIKTKNKEDDILNILDIGTGTGNIAISCANYFKNSIIEALDISKKAINISRINIIKNNINKNQIKLFKKNIFKFIPKKKYDIIVSNPPYIKTEYAINLIKEKTVCDPIIALDGGKDGLKYYHRLLVIADKCLKSNGAMYLEHGMDQRLDILTIFDNKNFLIKTYDDLSGIDRVVEVRLRS